MVAHARGTRCGAVVAFVLASLLLAPSAAALNLSTMGTGSSSSGGCLVLGPGGVGIDPDCVPSMAASTSSASYQPPSIDLEAALNGTSVYVSWAPSSNQEEVHAYRVLRGSAPAYMDLAATVSAEERDYVDFGAMWSGEAAWYRVVALDDEGVVIAESMTMLVQPTN